jgi:hypothetical protein
MKTNNNPPFNIIFESTKEAYDVGYADGYAAAKLKFEPSPWSKTVPEVDCMSGAFRPDEYPVWR